MSLTIQLQNRSAATIVYAYVIGTATNNNNALFLLEADGVTPYYPASPTTTGSGIPVNTAISLGNPGNIVNITIPPLAGGRIFFSYNTPLQFFLNPGPGLVEPSVTNPSDPNYQIQWGFMEFTYGNGIFANISYVDFVGIPIALTLTNTSGVVQHVSGYPYGGRITIANQLKQQDAVDNAGWSNLAITGTDGLNLRVLSPNSARTLNSSLLSTYLDAYITQVWSKYTTTALTVDTQASYGNVQGEVANNLLTFPNNVTFAKPSTADVFSCSTGPFAVSGAEQGTIVPRLAAAFNRTVLLTETETPIPTYQAYYQNPVTNHYARIVHANNLDGHGYAFPYDDVTPTGGINQAGTVSDGAPQTFVVTVGGVGATA